MLLIKKLEIFYNQVYKIKKKKRKEIKKKNKTLETHQNSNDKTLSTTEKISTR